MTRAEMRKLCDKHGIVFVEEDDPDNPVLREGTRIWFPGDSVRKDSSSKASEPDEKADRQER